MDKDDDTPPKRKSTRGFASMDPEKQRAIARKGGESVPNDKRSFSQNPKLAAEAGRKGGQRVDPEKRSFSQDPSSPQPPAAKAATPPMARRKSNRRRRIERPHRVNAALTTGGHFNREFERNIRGLMTSSCRAWEWCSMRLCENSPANPVQPTIGAEKPLWRRRRQGVAGFSLRDQRETEAWLLERRRSSQAERDAWARAHNPRD